MLMCYFSNSIVIQVTFTEDSGIFNTKQKCKKKLHLRAYRTRPDNHNFMSKLQFNLRYTETIFNTKSFEECLALLYDNFSITT